MTPSPTQASAPPVQASGTLLLLMAIACGLCAGCNYINQPLLHSIAIGLNVTEAQAAYSVTVSQLAYAGGLLFLVPLGDLLDRRKLIVTLMALAAAGLLLCAITGQIALFWIGSAIAGVFSVAAQVLVPLVTLMVAPQQAGRAVGILMTGLLIGIQSARSIAGILSGTAGWQSVYVLTAVLMLIVAAALAKTLPSKAAFAAPAKAKSALASSQASYASYASTMRSLVDLFTSQPRLRSRTWMGAFSFGSLAVLFSTMALLLGKAPHNFNDLQIGLLSLVGVASALVAKPVGQWADRGLEPKASLASAILLLAVWPPMWLAAHSASIFAMGLLLLGVAIAIVHICNQSVIFQLASQARSRANAIYMTGYFLGASAGSALGVVAWDLGGWSAVCWLGLALAGCAMAACLHDRKLAQRTHPAQ